MIFLQSILVILDLSAVILLGILFTILTKSYGGNPLIDSVLIFLEDIFDWLDIKSENNNAVVIIFTIVVVLFLVKSIVNLLISRKIFLFLSTKQSRSMSKALLSLDLLPYAWIKRLNKVEFSTSIIKGISALVAISLGQVIILISEMLLIISLLILLFAVNAIVTSILVIIVISIAAIFSSLISKRVKIYNDEINKSRITAEKEIFDYLDLFKIMKLTNKSEHLINNLTKKFSVQSKFYASDIWIQQVPKYFIELVFVLTVGLSGLFITLYNSDYSAIPIITIFLAAFSRILPSLLRSQNCIFTLNTYWYLSESGLDLIKDIQKLLNSNLKSKDRNIQNRISQPFYIEGHGINFGYEEEVLLRNLNFRINQGDKIAIAGPSGSGKSTLLDVIMGFLTPTSGTLDIKVNSVLGSAEEPTFGYLPQETVILDADLDFNITLCEFSELSDMDRNHLSVLKEKLSLYTILSNNSTNNILTHSRLSVGEKQKLGIARALYAKPNILILDEATSSLDAESEKIFLNLLLEVASDTTIIMVAHRLSSIIEFQTIWYMVDGEIIDTGSFDYLRNAIPRFDTSATLLGIPKTNL